MKKPMPLLLLMLVLANSGCVSVQRLERLLPAVNASELTLTVKATGGGNGRLHAKNLRNEGGVKSADEYHANVDTMFGSVSYEAKNYSRPVADR
jgi:hypothetical protein